MSYYRQHLFFCTNRRQNGRCCAEGNAEDYRNYAKQKLKREGIHGPGLCRVSASGCLGRCEEGPILVVYPEGTWHSYKTYKDIDEILNKIAKSIATID